MISSSPRSSHLAHTNRLHRKVRALPWVALGLLPALAWAVTDRSPGTFAVSPTGEGTYTVPLELPPGTHGLTPKLAFVYGSQRGNGLLGMGLRLSGFSAITRCPRTLSQDGQVKPVSNDANDKLCLDGNKLRLTGGTYGATASTYQTELETFAKVTLTGAIASGASSFEVKQKNGLIYEYGNTTDSRVELTGSATVVRLWALNKIRDRDGNYIEFTYTEDNANGAYRPNQIKYTGNTGQGLSPAYVVQFLYDARSTADPLVGYQNGYKQLETNKLWRITVTYNGTRHVRWYSPVFSTTATSTSRTRVENIWEDALDGGMAINTVLFDWQLGTSTLDAEVNTGTSLTAGTVVHSIDANGDGRTDVVYASGGNWTVQYGQAGGTFGTATSTGIAATNPGTSHSIDYNGDGLRDVLFSDGTNWRVLQSNGAGFTQVLTGKAATGAATGQIKVADVDGDGLEDLAYVSGTALKVRLNTISGLAATDATFYTLPAGNSFDTNPFGAPGVEEYRAAGVGRGVDFNGDGRMDLLAKTIPTGGGATTWRTLISMGTSYVADVTVTSAAAERPLTLDLNGDGLSDLIGRNGGNWIVTFARGGHDPAVRSLFDPTAVSPVISSALTSALVMDYNNDGFDDVLVNVSGAWSLAKSSRQSLDTLVGLGYTAGSDARALDLDGDGLADLGFIGTSTWRFRRGYGTAPDLVTGATDAFGIYVTPSYKALPQLLGATYSRSATPTFPDQPYTGTLQVVQQYVFADGTGGSSLMQPSYVNANRNLQGRGFLGFSRVTMLDDRTNFLSRVDYSQTFPYIGMPTTTTYLQADGTTKVSESINTFANVSNGAGFEVRKFPYFSGSTAKRWEVGGTYNGQQINQVVTSVTMDAYGNPYDVTTTTTESATANGIQSGVNYVRRTYTPTANLTNDTTNWCLGQRGQIQDIRSHTAYGGTAVTRTTNQTWDAAKCRVTTRVVEPGNATRQVTIGLGFDGYGNVNSQTVTGIGMVARTTTTSWGTSGQFPITVTNPLSETTTYGYEFANGTRTSVTDPNGIATTTEYDARGRPIRINLPNGTASTRVYNDCFVLGCDNSNGPNEVIVIDRTLDTLGNTLTERWTYTDELNRPLVSTDTTLSGAWNRVDRQYDDRGLLAQQSAPCWFTGCTNYWTVFSYDDLGRRTSSQRPRSAADSTAVYTHSYFEGLTTRAVDELGMERKTIATAVGRGARSVEQNGYYQTTDVDPFANVVRVVDSAGVTLQTATFDVRGLKTASTDPDLGSWGYAYNALGEPSSQTDANSKTTTYQFDKLSRMTQRVEPEGAGSITSTFTWGVAADNTVSNKYIGRLKSQQISGTGITTYSEAFTFDALSRLSQTTFTEGANSYLVDQSYDTATGYLATLTYPTSTASYRLKLQYEYQSGKLARVKDYNAPTTVYWQGNATDARQRVIDDTVGNGLQTVIGLDPVTARMDYIMTGPGGGTATQNLSYLFDDVGNLVQRQDNNQGLSENFYYDSLHRLDYSTLGGSTNLDLTLSDSGNVTYKSGVGTYTYHATKVHAVSSINTGGGTLSYGYDADGNMTNDNGTTLTWFASNLPKSITKDANNSSAFEYGPGRGRWKHVYKTGGTTYTHTYIGTLMEKVVSGATTSYKHYLTLGNGLHAVRIRSSAGSDSTYYLHDDHLGSTSQITDGAGSNVVAESFDAFGDRRGTNWTGDPTSGELATINGVTRRGFTDHEMLDSTTLVHMNGRAYNPIIGRFVSADPYTDFSQLTQGRNRYAYVGNRSLSSTDPSGFCADSGNEPNITTVLDENGNPIEQVTVTPNPYASLFSRLFDVLDDFSMRTEFDSLDIFEQGYANSSRFSDSVFETIFPGAAATAFGGMEFEARFNETYGAQLDESAAARERGDYATADRLLTALGDATNVGGVAIEGGKVEILNTVRGSMPSALIASDGYALLRNAGRVTAVAGGAVGLYDVVRGAMDEDLVRIGGGAIDIAAAAGLAFVSAPVAIGVGVVYIAVGGGQGISNGIADALGFGKCGP